MTDYHTFISINSDIRFGKPCITGSRISVYDVLSWLASGMSKAEILMDYPELTDEKIQACLSFAADREHKTRIAS
jgi:uncharacterized protein (DUF433 family)